MIKAAGGYKDQDAKKRLLSEAEAQAEKRVFGKKGPRAESKFLLPEAQPKNSGSPAAAEGGRAKR